MTDTPAAKALTESLLTVIRQQRHYGARIIISTQEPTISPRLIDLCAVTVVHRFSSPQWFNVLRQHISISNDTERGVGPVAESPLFEKILGLRTGEALIFAPSAVVPRGEDGAPAPLKERLLTVRVRKRLTWDGGRSIMCL
jgi:DNA helicase HerA-like ATPase